MHLIHSTLLSIFLAVSPAPRDNGSEADAHTEQERCVDLRESLDDELDFAGHLQALLRSAEGSVIQDILALRDAVGLSDDEKLSQLARLQRKNDHIKERLRESYGDIEAMRGIIADQCDTGPRGNSGAEPEPKPAPSSG